jgi:hypothetical protein
MVCSNRRNCCCMGILYQHFANVPNRATRDGEKYE